MAAIETYESLTDGKAYTVTYTAADGTESSASFTATDGTVSDIALNTYSIPANTPTEIKYQTLDANGVIIAEAGIGSGEVNMEISIENTNGYQSGSDLLLYNTGDTATVKAVYHTFKYNNTTGTEEGVVEKSFTITAVDQSTVIETFDYTVADIGKLGAIDFKQDKLVTQIAVGDDASGTPCAFFSFRTADGKDITESLDYSVSSGNENVLLASGTVAGYAQLTPIAAGATYLVIKNAAGNVVTTLPITVVAKRSLSTMSVDKSTVTIAAHADAIGAQKITVTVMDQYSDPYTSYTPADRPELKSNNDPGTLDLSATKDSSDPAKTVITVSSGGLAKSGTYVYTLDLVDNVNANNTKKISFTVIVSANLDATSTYALVMKNNSEVVSKVDTTVKPGSYSAITLVPVVVEKNNGSIKAEATVSNISNLKLYKNGVLVSNSAIYNQLAAAPIDAAIHVTTGSGVNADNAIEKYLEPATYTVTFTATIAGENSPRNMSTSFVVEDTQGAFAAKVNKTTIPANNLASVFENPEYVTFTYAGNVLKTGYSYADSDTSKINQSQLNVKNVTMNVKLPGTGDKYVMMTANIGLTFTVGSSFLDDEAYAAARAQALENAIADLASVTGAALTGATSSGAAVTGNAVELNINLSGVASGSSIKIIGEVNNVSCSALTSAGLKIGDAVTVNPSSFKKSETEPNIVTVTLPFTYNAGQINFSDGDYIVIEYTITVTGYDGTVSASLPAETIYVEYTVSSDDFTGGVATNQSA